jgi:chemotaxis protein CheC
MLTSDKVDNGFDISVWSRLAHSGSTNAFAGFSKMINQEITIRGISLEEVLPRNATSLIGGADDQVIAVYLSFNGDTSGHIMLAFHPDIAYELVDMIMGQPKGSTNNIGELERSAIGEVGNVVGAFFLNTIADSAGQRLLPSPPQVSVDTVRSIMNSAMSDIFQQNKPLFGIKLSFSTPGHEIEGRFLVMPGLG